MFLVVNELVTPSVKLNKDLDNGCLWTNQWKMLFNSDPSMQAQQIIFSRKINKVHHLPLPFNGSAVQQIPIQKHLGIYLDEELCLKMTLMKR